MNNILNDISYPFTSIASNFERRVLKETYEKSQNVRYIVFQNAPDAKNASPVKWTRYTISASCSSLIFSLHIFRITS